MKNKKVTLYDVAKEADVSIATVSNVLNKKKRETSEPTKKKVVEAIERLGYSPNEYARGLKMGKTNLVALIIPDQNPFFTEILKGVNEQCDAFGLQVIVASSEENETRQNELVDTFITQNVTGIILVPVRSSSPVKEKWSNFPIVLIDREMKGYPLPTVSAANVEASQRATDRLIQNGHQKIGIILASPDISTTVYRHVGYREAFTYRGMPVDSDYIYYGGNYGGTESQIRGGYQAVLKLLAISERPTGIIATNHLLMLGALKAFKDKEIQVPGEMAFIGFDDHPWNEIATPSITVISQPAYEMGKQAIKTLKQVEEEKKGQSIQLPVDLIIRESCGTHLA